MTSVLFMQQTNVFNTIFACQVTLMRRLKIKYNNSCYWWSNDDVNINQQYKTTRENYLKRYGIIKEHSEREICVCW